jgi:hypothetical protein
MAACLRQEQAANLYSDKRSAVDASRSARDSLQLISQPLRATKSVSTNLTSTLTEVTINVVPLGSFLGGCPPPLVTFPATRLGFLRATWLTTSGSSLVVATRFYPGAQKTFRSSWQAFRLQLRASIASANRSAFTLSQSLTTPFASGCPAPLPTGAIPGLPVTVPLRAGLVGRPTLRCRSWTLTRLPGPQPWRRSR